MRTRNPNLRPRLRHKPNHAAERSIAAFVAILAVVPVAVLGLASCTEPGTQKAGGMMHNPQDEALAGLSFMVGAWQNEEATRDSWAEERWSPEAGHSMFGANRVIKNGQCVFFEFLRIEHDPSTERIVYYAAPNGRFPPTAFAMAEIEPGERVVFENHEHDFPNRIIYEYDDATELLTMRIEGEKDRRPASSEWRMVRLVE